MVDINNKSGFYTRLPDKGTLLIQGETYAECARFLQPLITQDVLTLEVAELRYGCLLTPQGKFLHDFFITRGEDVLILVTEPGERADDLMSRLNRYKLRQPVEIQREDGYTVFVNYGYEREQDVGFGDPDPRHPDLGRVVLVWEDDVAEVEADLKACFEHAPFETYDRHRIKLGIPDGSRDMIAEKSTMLESGIDRLNGVDFEKGCYVGQELTARMHYRALLKKRLYAVRGDTLPDFGTRLETPEGVHVGEMRSSSGTVGLALLKDNALDHLPACGLSLVDSA